MKIQLIDLYKTYISGDNKVHALKPCSLNIESGEQLAITGTSGSGKSTLLHLIGLLDAPSGGEILYDGNIVKYKNENILADFRLKYIGFIFQSYNLLPELTAYENIILPSLLEGKKADINYLESIFKRLDLSERLNHLPDQLSGGQQQRVAIARAIANRPKILLCDEPTGNLDSKNSMNVIQLLNNTAEEFGISLIVVTHDENVAKFYKRRLIIEDGIVGGDL